MKHITHYWKRIALLCLMAAAGLPQAAGQTNNDWDETYKDYTIIHKPQRLENNERHSTKWHCLYENADRYGSTSLDRFEYDKKYFTTGVDDDIMIQPAHHVVDTVYAYPGQTITLMSPDIRNLVSGENSNTVTQNERANNRTYQRWYNYRTDGAEFDGGAKLLKHKEQGRKAYKLKNGFVGYPLTHADTYTDNGKQVVGPNLWGVQFKMPDKVTEDTQEFIVACDVSIYTDYGTGEFNSVSTDNAQTTKDAFMNTVSNECYEPTIGHRLIYVVRSIDRPDNMDEDDDTFAFRKREYSDEDKYMTHTIHIPNKHVSKNTDEVIGLRMDAQNYKLPTEKGGGKEVKLTVKVANNNDANIQLKSPKGNTGYEIELSGTERFFHIVYPTDSEIKDGTKVDIDVVYKDVSPENKVIHYDIFFDAGTELLTDTQLKDKKYRYRTEDYLRSLYGEPFTELNMDYDEKIGNEYGNSEIQYYNFPMPWESSSYGFHDGGPNRQFEVKATNINRNADLFTVYGSNTPTWGYYAFKHKKGTMQKDNDEDGNPIWRFKGMNYPGNTYYMQLDLSDRPGVIARLPFRDKLCPAAELFVTAWVNTPHANETTGGNTTVDAGIRFSIMGKTKEGNWESIYSHNSGQITRRDAQGNQLSDTKTDGEWQQVYFSFINSDANHSEYCLQLENASSSTNGADLFLDKIQVFMAKPGAIARQKNVTCDGRTMMNFRINWDQLSSRLGIKDNEESGNNATAALDFCLLDTLKYRQVIPYGSTPDSDDEIKKAIEAAAVWIGNNTEYNRRYGTLYYYKNYDKNAEYKEDKDNLALKNNIGTDESPKYAFYKLAGKEGEPNYIAIDIQADLIPTRTYWLLLKDHNDGDWTNAAQTIATLAEDDDPTGDTSDSDEEKADENDPYDDVFSSVFAKVNPDDQCAMRTELAIEGQNIIKVNNQLITPENLESYCVGQQFKFSVDMKYTTETGEEKIYDKNPAVYFDWFFGPKEEFEENFKEDGSNGTEHKVSLKDALAAFRAHYPDATKDNFKSCNTKDAEDDKPAYTDDHKAVIQYLLDKYIGNEAVNPRLVLRAEELDIRLLAGGLDLTVMPIQEDDATSDPDSGEGNEGSYLKLCFQPIYLHLGSGGRAPRLQPGFEYMKYQNTDFFNDEDFNPAMRIGLKQIKAASGEKGKPIKVHLRNAKFAFGEGNEEGKPGDYKAEHLGRLHGETDGEGNVVNYLYLVASDDPAYKDYFGADMHQYVVGWVDDLEARPLTDGEEDLGKKIDENCMKIRFNLDEQPNEGPDGFQFIPKEGYSYTMHIHMQEHASADDHETNTGACYGHFDLVMKVVPEYLMWTGEGTDNWQDDKNWKRVTSASIKKANADAAADKEHFTDGSVKTEKAYVPMLFTKVIIPKGKKLELFDVGFEGDMETLDNMTWNRKNRPDYIQPPAIVDAAKGQPIYYDMMVYSKKGDNTDMETKPYRMGLCDEIHFEPGAEMVHAEYLLYKKAYVDYELDGGKWYTLASPLQGVVAGDFYTDKTTGKEEQEYFTDITFDGKTADASSANNANVPNSRFSPTVYQRAWSGTADMTLTDENNKTSSRAISGNWSSLYNDVTVPYTAGTGFSLRVQDLPSGTDKALFRLPKADKSYSYYSSESDNTGSSSATISNESRTKAGLLCSDDLFKRVVDDPSHNDEDDEKAITVVLGEKEENETYPVVPSENSDYYLIGNPFIAQLDMKKFFDTNREDGFSNTAIEQKYWYVEDGVQNVAIATEDGWISTDNATVIPPLRSFFVQKTDEAQTDEHINYVHFTADMQVTMENRTDATTASYAATANVLRITATTADGKVSRAAIAYAADAASEYETSEDAELLLDSNLSDVPTVYSVAGTMATSINRTSELYNIPLGVYGSNSREMVTLSFSGIDRFGSATLYDAELHSETPLYEGTTVSVPANTSGRYFLHAGTPTGNEVIRAAKSILIYSVGQNRIMVTSNDAPLKTIRVYGMNGSLIRQEKVNTVQHTLQLPAGIYLIVAEDNTGVTENAKALSR